MLVRNRCLSYLHKMCICWVTKLSDRSFCNEIDMGVRRENLSQTKGQDFSAIFAVLQENQARKQWILSDIASRAWQLWALPSCHHFNYLFYLSVVDNLGEGFFPTRWMPGFMLWGRCCLEMLPKHNTGVENTIILFKLFKVLRKVG